MDLTYVTYCGLYCRLCSNMSRIPDQAGALLNTMKDEGYEFFGPTLKDFDEFWAFLQELEAGSETCPGCRGGCGYPGCSIRPCARERDVTVCPECDDYPCEHIAVLARRYPTLLADGAKLQEVGLEKWLALQEARVRRGACYADMRYHDDT
jgi:hypothetical protein